MKLADIQKQVLGLSQDDRLRLASVLWDSISSEHHFSEESAETLKESMRRDQELERSIEAGISHEEVMNAMRQVINEARLSQRC